MQILVTAVSRFTSPTGICRHAANLVKCLEASEAVERVTLALGAWQHEYFAGAFGIRQSGKIHIEEVGVANTSLSRNVWYATKLPRVAREWGADLVHLSFPVPVIRRLFPCSIVSTIHDLYPYDYPENFGFPNYLFNRLFLRVCVQNSDGVVCVSDSTLGRLQDVFGKRLEDKAKGVVYNVVDFAGVDSRKPAFISEDTRFLLCVAQHRKNKNLNLLLSAFAELQKRDVSNHETKLVVVGGEGPETGNLMRLAEELDVRDSVSFVFSLPEQELSWLYAKCAVFITASSIEGFCLPLVEAQACGSRIVCSDIPIFRELAGNCAEFFSLEGNAEEHLSAAMENTLRNGRAIHETKLERFSVSRIRKEYLKFYHELGVASEQHCMC